MYQPLIVKVTDKSREKLFISVHMLDIVKKESRIINSERVYEVFMHDKRVYDFDKSFYRVYYSTLFLESNKFSGHMKTRRF